MQHSMRGNVHHLLLLHPYYLLFVLLLVTMERGPTSSSAFCVVGVRVGVRGGEGINSGKPSLSSSSVVLVSSSGRSMTSVGAGFQQESSGGDEWTLEHDWALLDQVPKFTVGAAGAGRDTSSNQRRTFWAQLSAATPLLSRRNEMELLQRCQELEEDEDDVPCCSCGPSPPLLQHWSVSSEGRVTGQTEDGRTIWLQSHVIGRLEGDPLTDHSSLGAGGGVCNLLPGGYVEAVGGRVYELGLPRRQTYPPPPTTQTVLHNNDDDDDMSSVDDNSRRSSKSGMLRGWWMPATSTTVAAILVYSVMTACIGYGAGLSFTHHYSAMPSTTATTTTSSMVYHVPRPSKSSETKTMMSMAPEQTQISVSEQRAKLEARVLREQRMIQTIHKSLESDQINLQGLRQQEQLNPNRLQP